MAIRWLLTDRESGNIIGGPEGIPNPTTHGDRKWLRSIIKRYTGLGEAFAAEDKKARDIDEAWRQHNAAA